MLFTHSNYRFVATIVAVLFVALVMWVAYVAYHLHSARQLSLVVVADTVPFSLQDTSRVKKLLVLGDSTAYGVGARDPLETTAARVGDALLMNVDNVSASGAKVHELRDQLLRAPGNKYDLALIQVGANDVIYFSSLKDAAEDLDVLLTSISSRASRIVFLTSGDIGRAPLWPMPLNWIYTSRTKAWREIVMPILAKHGVIYVDLLSLPDPFLSDVARYYAPDGLHLSGDGYAVWAGYILDALHETKANN